MESELFGHARGAFTGAATARPGLFREADGGTLFLDEVGELPAPVQVKLNRALQEGEIRPVGEARSVKVDVRVVAATLRDLRSEVDAGRFREDLYYRLNVFPVRLPPLRERRSDIPLLAGHLLKKHARAQGRALEGFEADALAALAAYAFPGNVRELENVVERAVAVCTGPRIDLAGLPPQLRQTGGGIPGRRGAGGPALQGRGAGGPGPGRARLPRRPDAGLRRERHPGGASTPGSSGRASTGCSGGTASTRTTSSPDRGRHSVTRPVTQPRAPGAGRFAAWR